MLVGEPRLAKMRVSHKIALALFSACAGAALVVGAFKFSYLNWIVDGPGWAVGRFMPMDLHEGEGAFGFLLAILLSWLWTSLLIVCITYWGWQYFKSAPGTRNSGSGGNA